MPSQKLEAGTSKLFHEIRQVKSQGQKKREGKPYIPAVAGFLCYKTVVKSAVPINTIIGALQLFFKNMSYIFSPFSFPFTFDFLGNGYSKPLFMIDARA